MQCRVKPWQNPPQASDLREVLSAGHPGWAPANPRAPLLAQRESFTSSLTVTAPPRLPLTCEPVFLKIITRFCQVHVTLLASLLP